MAEHVDLIREAARVYRAGHTPTDAGRRRIAELLDGAAAREDKHVALQPRLPGHVVEPPGVGDEAWLAHQIALALLGREKPCGTCSGNGCPDCDPRIAVGVADYDSGAGWERVAEAFERHGVDAVLADPGLVEDAPPTAVAP